jgi:hypothetical protein
MICDRSTLLKLEKHLFITINMTIPLTTMTQKTKPTNASLGGGGLTACAPDHMTQI